MQTNLITHIARIMLIAAVGLWIGTLAVANAQAILPKPSTLPGPSVAQQEAIKAGEQTKKTGGYGISVVVPFIAQASTGFAALAAFFSLLYAGIRYLMAYDESAAGEAKKLIIWSLIGLVITLLSYSIVSIIIKIKIG